MSEIDYEPVSESEFSFSDSDEYTSEEDSWCADSTGSTDMDDEQQN